MTATHEFEQDIRRDPLHRMRAYQLGDELRRDAWDDVEALKTNAATIEVGAQLYRAIGSICANLAEGYSRSSGRDRARIFEYALGSARESIEWYSSAAPVLGQQAVHLRQSKLVEIRRLLIATIPRERSRLIRPGSRGKELEEA